MQSLQIVLTRENQSVPWGFRLKGGAEYNVPLSILKVNPGSPAYNKLECTDQVQSIGNYSAIYLKHEEALNIIRLFEYHLPLVVKRESATENENPNNSLFWSPSQVPNQVPEPSKFQFQSKPASNFNSSFQHNLTAGPAWPSHQPVDHHLEQKVDQSHHDESADYKSQYQYQPIYQQSFPIGLQQDGAPPLVVPPPLIRAMTGSALGKKPFTYTPGGLDLSHIRESSRVKRYDQLGKNYEIRPQEQQQQRAFTPSFVDEHGEYQTFISNDSAYMKNKLKPVNCNEPQFGGVSAEHLVRPHKHKDLINQSTSFRMLNRWINESEAHPKPVEPEQRRHTEEILQASKVLRFIGEGELNNVESGVDRTSYVKHNAPLSPYTRLLKLKAQVDRSLGRAVKKPTQQQLNAAHLPPRNNVDESEKVPAGLRYQERDIAKFQGENIPSKTFKYLQYITQEELALEEQEKKQRAKIQHNQPAQPVVAQPAPIPSEVKQSSVVVESVIEPVNEVAPEQAVEPAPFEPAVEAALAEPAVEAVLAEPVVEAALAEPVVEAAPVEPAVEAAPVEPAVEAALAEPAVEAAPEEPVAEVAKPIEAAPVEPIAEAAPAVETTPTEPVAEAVEVATTEPAPETVAPTSEPAAESVELASEPAPANSESAPQPAPQSETQVVADTSEF